MKEQRDEKQVSDLFFHLKKYKEQKLSMMREIEDYLDPSDTRIMSRMSHTTEEGGAFDSKAETEMRKFSLLSLLDIFNSVRPWFTMLPQIVPKGMEEDKLRLWAGDANKKLFSWINKSPYLEALAQDKHVYNMYGFSSMALGAEDKQLEATAQDAFKVYLLTDKNKVKGVGFLREYTRHSLSMLNLAEDFKEDVFNESDTTSKFKVLVVYTPNNKFYVEHDLDESKGKFVERFYYAGTFDFKDMEENVIDSSVEFREIADRKYYERLQTVCPRDSFRASSDYGKGYGQMLLVTSINANKIHKNIVRSSGLKANPPVEAAPEVFLGERGLEEGTVYPKNYMYKEGIKILEIKDQLEHQLAVLDKEHEQIQDILPNVQGPKKASRQSQYEVQQQTLDEMKELFAFKISYLKQGVAEHLRIIYYLALDQGIIELPEGVSDPEVLEPSLDSLIQKEVERQAAQEFVVTIQMCSIILAGYKPGWDNFDKDKILRYISTARGAGMGLHPLDVRKKIRELRVEMQKQQAQAAQAAEQAKSGALQAKGRKDDASAQKTIKEARDEGE